VPKIWIDGKYYDKDDAKVSVFDHGVLYGDGSRPAFLDAWSRIQMGWAIPKVVTANGPASVVAAPTVLAQVEAEVERRKALYKQLPGNPKSLNESNADNLVRSRSELMLRIRLMLDEYNDLVRPLGESEREIDEVTHIARVGRK